eukprot:CAMPEP_0118944032 /NCGR_PEP_ID=MMETSP1169-20130426/39528_1 /TAXON_ID=36882 /ORGANISM="Pyramimonas obovata, Strain CCMP722" /LENGTH=312 /DNA_ID=CAMNT_0006889433 /DNA_START=112 /DNA_END=1046 /DNA_ORIENTATION=+
MSRRATGITRWLATHILRIHASPGRTDEAYRLATRTISIATPDSLSRTQNFKHEDAAEREKHRTYAPHEHHASAPLRLRPWFSIHATPTYSRSEELNRRTKRIASVSFSTRSSTRPTTESTQSEQKTIIEKTEDLKKVLDSFLGDEEGSKLVDRSAILRRCNPANVNKTIPFLVEVLGAPRAREATLLSPRLLLTRDKISRKTLPALSEVVGTDNARQMLGISPNLVLANEESIKSSLPMLTKLLGMEGAMAAIIHTPSLLRLCAEDAMRSMEALREVLGAAEAASAVQSAPSLLQAHEECVRSTMPVLKKV